ncbi:malto-oligosyltrehalose synthase [Falsirhodobacter sp. 20TX0035]|uniref:malto-oligosyltrehalose synthase n=1 Tax=Falsirhodobacter sp. 20TX0035 TaxID=3022019 RepID=UPI00232BE152|nr:malto-oligosyltrehalose synthase [Falsirhodobacter sp. 20TX0035]MDB6452403.1 malto-oligosyltrehalose synthase [Falsirhodobacter sp. 20TX0035]
MPLPTALYHLLLREGRTFRTAIDLLPRLKRVGISHLYLSPIFQATEGSTHGYDVTDPTAIDASLGGREGFSELARAAKEAGIAIVLDIVPNHTAFNLENPWLLDVLKHGQNSRYARHFDIDWSKGRLVVPFLGEPFDAARFRVEGDQLTDGTLSFPLRPGTAGDDIAKVHEDQAYRLTFWEMERDSITHRRFFNVTGLIGMRVEDEAVFEDTHALIFALVRSGEVQGLRVDHIDGLADPKQYLDRLAAALPDTPVWVEKILTGPECLPDEWKTMGTTGYESARALARVLTDAKGFEAIDAMWREATGRTGDFETALDLAKEEVIEGDLAAELLQLVELGRAALGPKAEAGDAWLREAIVALLRHFPRYRTYFNADTARDEDRRIMEETLAAAAQDLRTDRVARLLVDALLTAPTPEAERFRMRFQQVTGALLAKSHEDTAAFRWNRYLATNEVGGLPDEATLDVAGFDAFLQGMAPSHVNLTSTHDTKRAEDARMRLVAISHLPRQFAALWQDSTTLPEAEGVDPNLRWFIVQTLLAVWQDRDDLGPRLRDHLQKAMREAKEITNWTHPREEAEGKAQAFAAALLARWTAHLPEAATVLMRRADQLSLAQVALKFAMPGIPYIYQGTESLSYHLTDPDNRLPVDYSLLDTLDTPKARLTRAMMALRQAHPAFFENASAHADAPAPNRLRLIRDGDGRLEVTVALDGTDLPAGNIATDTGAVRMNWSGV